MLSGSISPDRAVPSSAKFGISEPILFQSPPELGDLGG
jgi:hypothetical protein